MKKIAEYDSNYFTLPDAENTIEVYQSDSINLNVFINELPTVNSKLSDIKTKMVNRTEVIALLEKSLRIANFKDEFEFIPSDNSKDFFVLNNEWNDILFGWCEEQCCYAISWYTTA